MATGSVFVLATVVSIRDNFFYPCCTRCHKKVRTPDDEAKSNILCCERCCEEYSAESVQYRYRISVVASDRTQLAQVTVFGSCLDKFFGASATNFARFANGLKFAPLPISWNRLVNQAVEQCFVGSLLQFGFRVYSPSRTTSQVAHNSPFHLKNLVKKQRTSENKSFQSEGLPSLLACQIFHCSSPDQQNPTVLQILNEYLQEFHRNTPQSFSLRSSMRQSQHSPLIDRSETEVSREPSFATRCTSLQRNRASPMYCTPQEFYSMITPLVLTGTSQPSSGSITKQEKPPEFKKLDLLHQWLKDHSDQVSSQNKGINSNNSNSLSFTQFVTPGVWDSEKLNTNFVNDCRELHASHEWTEYNNLSSSEELSAFLADLERDALNKEDGQTLPTLHSEKYNSPQSSATSDEVMSDDVTSQLMTSQILSLREVICGLSQTSIKEDFTEFTDFPSSEDLDAFLADMELYCENIPRGKSLSPTAAVGSAVAFHSKLHHNAECRTWASNEHMVQDIVDTDHTEHSNNILNFSKLYEDKAEKEQAICDRELSSDGFCTLNDSVRPPCSARITSNSDNIESSDSQFLRDCESVLTEFTVNTNHEKDRIENKLRSHSLVLNNQRQSTCIEDSTKRRKCFYRSRSTDGELHGEHIVSNMPLEHEEANIVRSHDRNTNQTEVQQGNQTAGNNEAPGDEMSNDSFELMACSPDLFSQSLSRVEEVCSETRDLFSSPRLIEGESRSKCTKHLSGTPDLFSYPLTPRNHTRSCSRLEMNSASLFSCSDHSHLSSISPLSLRGRLTSFPCSSENEADGLPIINRREVEKQFVRNSQAVSFHSTPCHVNLRFKRLHRIWTPAGVSPLLSDSINEDSHINVQGTPILFSPMSTSSL